MAGRLFTSRFSCCWRWAVSRRARPGHRRGFPKPVHDLLASDPELVVAAAEMLLAEHFPSSERDAVRAACGLRWDWSLVQPQPKDPEEAAFRTRVLNEYRNRCSICDFDARVNDRVFALEAARIQWPSHGGPNAVSNALALCLLHHKALNHGALGLQHEGEGYRVLLSRNVAGSSPAAARLMALQGNPSPPTADARVGPLALVRRLAPKLGVPGAGSVGADGVGQGAVPVEVAKSSSILAMPPTRRAPPA